LPALLAQAALRGPVLVMLGRVFGIYAGTKSSAPRADQKAG
jgi:UDP-N-acetyl-D-mannosaminuronic acid transferase (WecB/TagA/CpsF family)